MTPANPYRSALKLIGIIGCVFGALLLIIAAAVYNTALMQFQLYGDIPDTANSDALIVWGSWFVGIGVVSLLLWLVVSSLGWDARLAPEPTDPARPLEEVREQLRREADGQE